MRTTGSRRIAALLSEIDPRANPGDDAGTGLDQGVIVGAVPPGTRVIQTPLTDPVDQSTSDALPMIVIL